MAGHGVFLIYCSNHQFGECVSDFLSDTHLPGRMIFFTVLFTLEGKNPAENHYVYMLMLLLKTLQRTGTYLLEEDSFYIMADADTVTVLKEIDLEVLSKVQYILFPRPKTLLEGTTHRYEFFRHVYEPDSVTLYMDLDMVCCKQFRPELPADTMAVCPEGDREDPNYCGTCDGKVWATLDHPGLSSGFWFVRIGPKTAALMERILALISEHPGDFYTLEQPHFNAAITKGSPVVFLKGGLVSFNATEDDISEGCFVNLAGEPGNGAGHFLRMLNCFLTII